VSDPEPADIPDLLSATPTKRIDVAGLRQALVFAFAAGGSIDTFDDALANAILPESSWDRSEFARDVYLDELVSRGLSVHIEGRQQRTSSRYLTRVLSAPPRDSADVETRRDVLRELAASAGARRELERVYLAIVRLRSLLCAARQPAPRVRRVEILRASREAFELLAASFDESHSALSRLRAFGRTVVSSPGHTRLAAFLDHDEHLGSLDLRVRVGSDGEVRAMEIVRIREDTGNPFHVSVIRRFIVRLILFFRGYRTTGGEVAERLLSEVFAGVEEPVALLFQLLGDIELYLGSLGFRDRAQRAGLEVSLPDGRSPASPEPGRNLDVAHEKPLELHGLFNPLLLAAGVTPVTSDVKAKPGSVVIVTGPNSGGKTRLLQAIAIAQLFAEAGLFVPVRSACIPRATGLFASLYEEARSDAPEGHLGMELLRIRRMFDEVGAGSLVVLDELCSGTNPSEGEEIARLVLSLLPELGVQAFVTTHLLKFAAELAQERPFPSLDFLQVELDALERPTYRFMPGVAKTSLAQKTAARLGVTREELLERILAKKRAAE
jgi:DNA mismatch repair protein MutS2